MITEKLQNAINEQITAEMWSSNLYLAMSFYMEKEGYCGMASWLKKQSFEEHAHACELASYIIKRGGKAKLDKVDVVPNDFGTPLEVFEQVYEHECRVSKMIDALVDVAAAEKDKASQDFLGIRSRAGRRRSYRCRYRGYGEESRCSRNLLY